MLSGCQGCKDGIQFGLLEDTQFRLGYLASSIEEHRKWQAARLVSQIADQVQASVVRQKNRVVNFQFSRKFADFSGLIDGDTYNFYTSAGLRAAYGHQERDLFQARSAPRGPEIHHDDLA